MKKTFVILCSIAVLATIVLGLSLYSAFPATSNTSPNGFRRGWGVIDISSPGDHIVKNYTLQAGSWFILAPVTLHGGFSPTGVDIHFTEPTPSTVLFGNGSAQPQRYGVPFPDDNQFTAWAWVVCTQTTKLSLIVQTSGEDPFGEVLDGDSFVLGL